MTQANQGRKPVVEEPEARDNQGPKLGDDSQSFIGVKLRELYDDVVAEPVPDRLLRLLEQLGDDDSEEKE